MKPKKEGYDVKAVPATLTRQNPVLGIPAFFIGKSAVSFEFLPIGYMVEPIVFFKKLGVLTENWPIFSVFSHMLIYSKCLTLLCLNLMYGN